MKIIVIDNDYPNEQNLYGDVFVHVRVKEYIKIHDCLVISLTAKKDFVYEGVQVKACETTDKANEIIDVFMPEIILVHFVLKNIIEEIIPKTKIPYVIWVHGYEALAWYRRLYDYSARYFITRSFFYMVLANRRQLKSLAGLIHDSNSTSRISFVFVSNWMKNICEADTSTKIHKSKIVANPIDVKLFKYTVKEAEKRTRILLIRSFGSKKYATDIATNAITLLSDQPFFNQLYFTIVGEGTYYDKHTRKLRGFTNVTLVNRFLNQQEIKQYHDENGIFLCPTRQDAQGVSMCEAMSSGLVPITSFNTAIPEFVANNVTGFLTQGPKDIAKSISYLFNNPEKFLAMSTAASKSIKEKCSIDNIVALELEIILNK